MASRHVDAIDKERFAIARALPDEVVAVDARLGECSPAAVAPGVDEEGVTRLGDGLCRRDPFERVRRRAVTTSRPRDHMQGPAARGQGGQRPRRDHHRPTRRAAVRVEQIELHFIGRVGIDEEDAPCEAVETVVVDAYERQGGAPRGRALDPILNADSGVVVGVSRNVPLDPDGVNRGIGEHLPGRGPVLRDAVHRARQDRENRGEERETGAAHCRVSSVRTAPCGDMMVSNPMKTTNAREACYALFR